MRIPTTVVVALLLAPTIVVAQHPLLMLPLDDPAYPQLQSLDQRGCVAARVSAYRPFLVRDVRRALLSAASDSACQSPVLTLLRQRFAADTVRSDSIAAALVQPGVVPDTGRGAFVHYVVRSDTIDAGGAERLDWGAIGTLRATGLSNGEFYPLWQDVLPTNQASQPLVALGRARVRYSAGPLFLAVAEIWAQSDMRNDPSVRSKSLRHTGSFLAPGESYLNARLGPIAISFGRADEAWLGEGRESLVLSAHGPTIDRLMLSGTWSKVQGRAFYGALTDVTLTTAQDSLAPTASPARFNRFLVGHALSWEPVPQLELTAGETMLFARRGPPIDFAYFNPVMSYEVAQADTGFTTEPRDNAVVFGGARAHIGPAIIGGELIVDDIQIDPHDPAHAQNQLGFALRASIPLPGPVPLFASGSYTNIDSYTYTRPWYSEVYQNYNRPLGSTLGPDADLLQGQLELWPTPVVQLTAGAGFWRHGANRIDRRPAEGPNFHKGEPYPSTRTGRPDVQTATIGSFAARLLTPVLPLTARLDLANISDVNNQPGAAALYVRFRLEASYAIKYP